MNTEQAHVKNHRSGWHLEEHPTDCPLCASPTATPAAAARFKRIAQERAAMLLEVHSDGGIEFSIELAGHWTAFAIDPTGGKARLLG